MTRITKSFVEDRIRWINEANGLYEATRMTVGAYRLGSAYGGYRLELVVNDSGGITDVTKFGYESIRRVYDYAGGMLEVIKK